ncbi:TPR_REGION domain-containing protein [Pseudozyma hubeiensis]|nr:TPR_REGION domain-containing protein [Pseudozyma hubeiensis]
MSAGQTPPDKAKAQAAKQKGNEAFAKKQWADAVGHYTVAHYADPTEPTYPLNRAMAYIKLSKFVDAERDCTTALVLSPNNVKALYRKATAQVGADKLQPAIENFEAVLQLDPKNVEAKAGLLKAQEALLAATSKREKPIDLRGLKPGSRLSAADDSGQGSGRLKSDAVSQEPSSSVEAARKFLQQVGMSDDDQDMPSQSALKGSTSALPARLPGETGGFLREVTTRKTVAKPASQQHGATIVQPLSDIAPTSSSLVSAEANVYKSPVAQKTASALNFGAATSQSPAVPPPQQPRRRILASPGKMSAIEFQRRWKNKSERLDLLSVIEPETIPDIIGSMLEPELVGEMLQTLVEQQRSSPDDVDLSLRVEGILQALPQCKRFGMTVCMLDSTEKANAAHLIQAIGRPELRSVWEVN